MKHRTLQAVLPSTGISRVGERAQPQTRVANAILRPWLGRKASRTISVGRALAALAGLFLVTIVPASPAWQLESPDHVASPRSGMSRDQWKACALHLAEKMFSALPSMAAPLVFPRIPGKTYPRPDQPVERFQAAELEGFTRSLNLVAPLIQEDPEIAIRGTRLLDYYLRELVAITTPGSPRMLPLLSGLGLPERENWQMTCELGGLSTILLLYPRLWDALSTTQRDHVAALIADYAGGPTAAHNWRWFNVMMMVFLNRHGYPIDRDLMGAHVEALMALDAGEGWFRDARFDYYNSWVFHLYAPIWCRYYGYENDPAVAALMERQSREMMAGFPRMFARNGHMPMWGRSIAYRTGAVAALPAAFLFRNPPPLDPGWARRIVSGNLLQFVTREDFLENGVPALGFYGHFEPCLQSYSCAASPMWGYLTFLAAFSLPADHPFWRARENEGMWSELRDGVAELTLDAPGIQIVNYGRSGHSELRTGKAGPDDPNYNRLAFHTAFPWEALDPASGMAMHYTRRLNDPVEGEGFIMPVHVAWIGIRDGVLHRQLQMNRFVNGNSPVIDLADVSLPLGVLRVDRPRLILSGVLRLSHYGLPSLNGRAAEVERRTVSGRPAIIASIPGRQVALVALAGWDRLDAVVHHGFHPEADESTVIFAEWTHADRLPGSEPRIALLLHKADDAPWTDDELMPVDSWESPRISELGIRGVRIRLKEGRTVNVNYAHVDGGGVE